MRIELLRHEWLNVYGDPGNTYDEIVEYFSEQNIRHMFGEYDEEEVDAVMGFALRERGF